MNQKNKFTGIFYFILFSIIGLGSVNAQQAATATAVLSGQFVVQIIPTSGGSGYTFAPRVTISGGGGSGAAAYTTISGGSVNSIMVTNAGSGYTSQPQVIIQAPSTTPFSSSLVLDLPIDNGTIVDAGPYNFTVVTNGGGTWTPNRFSQANSALALNGVNQNISIPYDARLYPDEITLSAWVNFQQLSEAGMLWRSGNGSSDSWRGFSLQSDGSTLYYQDFTGNGYNAYLTVPIITSLTNRIWYQIVVTRTANSCSMFINGSKVASQSGLTPYTKPQATPLSLGANNSDPSGFGGFSHVTFDTFHIYNRGLSDSEVQTLYTTESINTNAVPTLGIVVKALRVNMLQLVPNDTYQLQETADFITWTNLGDSFMATNTSSYVDVDIIDTGHGNFRIVELP